MSGSVEALGPVPSSFGDNAGHSTNQCDGAESRGLGGPAIPFPYHSPCETAFDDDGSAEEVEPDAPRWLLNLLAVLGTVNPMKGIGPAVTDGILDAAAEAVTKGDKAKGAKDPSKTSPAPTQPPPKRKGGRQLLFSREKWREMAEFYKATRDYKATVKRFNVEGLSRHTLRNHVRALEKEKGQNAGQPHEASTDPALVKKLSSWYRPWGDKSGE